MASQKFIPPVKESGVEPPQCPLEKGVTGSSVKSKSLKKAGIDIAAFGKGWPGGTLSDREMVELYSRSRINLGFSGIGSSRRLCHLKGRDFEVPMSGGLYLTQDHPELELVYKVGGRFKLAALIQKRLSELLEGARPLVEREPGMTNIEIVSSPRTTRNVTCSPP